MGRDPFCYDEDAFGGVFRGPVCWGYGSLCVLVLCWSSMCGEFHLCHHFFGWVCYPDVEGLDNVLPVS